MNALLMDLPDIETMLPTISLDRVMNAINTVRIRQAGQQEASIHDAACAALEDHGITYRREYMFGPRCRADIWIDGIVIEIKKQRPARAALIDQLGRYADKPTARAIVVVMERSMVLPATINDKPIAVISLNALWGIAL